MPANHVRNTAVVGGKHTTDALLGTGKHTVTAITRMDSKAYIRSEVKVVKVDYGERALVVEALRGQQALIITMNAMALQTPLSIEAAATASVQWIMPNEYAPEVIGRPDKGKDSMLSNSIKLQHDLIEKHWVSSWIGLTNSYWYTFFLLSPYAFGFDVSAEKTTFFDDGKTPINTSTSEQWGHAVAALFSLSICSKRVGDLCLDRWRNKEVYVSSIFLTQRDTLESTLRVTAGEKRYWTIPTQSTTERYKQGLELTKDGQKMMQGFQQCKYSRVFYKDGSGDFRDHLDNAVLGLPKEKLDDATRQAVQKPQG